MTCNGCDQMPVRPFGGLPDPITLLSDNLRAIKVQLDAALEPISPQRVLGSMHQGGAVPRIIHSGGQRGPVKYEEWSQ